LRLLVTLQAGVFFLLHNRTCSNWPGNARRASCRA
jgi:hypothetical protein